jgi:hypothetical protein
MASEGDFEKEHSMIVTSVRTRTAINTLQGDCLGRREGRRETRVYERRETRVYKHFFFSKLRILLMSAMKTVQQVVDSTGF